MLVVSYVSYAQKSKPAPDLVNVHYGENERHVLDVWFADKGKTTPLAIYIHGGGFQSGSKERVNSKELVGLLEAGISVASISYRFKNKQTPYLRHIWMQKLALQFIRSKANEWNIDKKQDRCVLGGSAGAQICMWLAFSDEMAKPESANAVERESTRVTCVATKGGQTTMEVFLLAETYSQICALVKRRPLTEKTV